MEAAPYVLLLSVTPTTRLMPFHRLMNLLDADAFPDLTVSPASGWPSSVILHRKRKVTMPDAGRS